MKHKYSDECTCADCTETWNDAAIANLDKDIERAIQKKQATIQQRVKKKGTRDE